MKSSEINNILLTFNDQAYHLIIMSIMVKKLN